MNHSPLGTALLNHNISHKTGRFCRCRRRTGRFCRSNGLYYIKVGKSSIKLFFHKIPKKSLDFRERCDMMKV